MKIIDPDGKKREILSFKKVPFAHKDIKGNSITEDFVEVVIKGKNWNWKNWYPFKKFRELNPTLKI